MIKIVQLYTTNTNKFGGIIQHCEGLCSLFHNDKDISTSLVQDLPIGFIPILKKKVFRVGSLYRTLKEMNSDIVHIHGFADFSIPEAIFISLILHRKILYSPHYHPFEYLEHPIFGRLFFYVCLRPLLPFVAGVFTITDIDTKFFKRFHKHVFKIPHYFDSSEKIKPSLNKKKPNMILFVGRNEANKGIDYLYKLPPKYEVHCVTKGELKRKDFIIHTDISNEELNTLYNEASLVVIPSRYEAFSYVALEAFAHGTPVVMSDRVQIACYLKGKRGYSIFKYGEYPDFLNAVEKTIGSDVDVDSIMASFDKNLIKGEYKNVYLDAIKAV